MEDEKDRKAELADWNAKLKAADKLRNGDVKTEDSIADKEAELIKKKIEELKSEIKKSKKVNVEVTVGDDNEVTIDKKKELKK